MQDSNVLRSLFHAELDAEARRNGWIVEERVRWIIDQLDEYIDRWLGFAALPIPPHALVQSDFFTVLEIAIEALEQEFEAGAVSLRKRHLQDIRESIEVLRKRGNEECGLAIKKLVVELRSSHGLGT